MSAEDLDKLFRDKLNNRPVTPGNEAWERLQARMQQPALSLAQETEGKEEARPVIKMWYYSAAAAVTMLLGVGLWVNRDAIDPLQPGASIANVQTTQQPAIQESTGTSTIESVSPEVETSSLSQEEKAFSSKASSAPTQALATVRSQEVYPVSTPDPSTASRINRAERTIQVRQQQMNAEPVLVAVTTENTSQEKASVASESAPLEIIVKFDNTQATTSYAHASTTVDHTPQEEETSGSGRVLKGILKQVKHLKDGEKVNLSEMGISKQTFALETRIGNKKITKTIEL